MSLTIDLPPHITLDEPSGKADCSVCRTGATAPPSFGGIPRADILASFVIQHSVHKGTTPVGLTPTGRVNAVSPPVSEWIGLRMMAALHGEPVTIGAAS